MSENTSPTTFTVDDAIKWNYLLFAWEPGKQKGGFEDYIGEFPTAGMAQIQAAILNGRDDKTEAHIAAFQGNALQHFISWRQDQEAWVEE